MQQWSGLLLDHVLLSSQHPSVQDAYTSRLLGGGAALSHSPAVRGVYAAACPTVLLALASSLPPPAVLRQEVLKVRAGPPLR